MKFIIALAEPDRKIDTHQIVEDGNRVRDIFKTFAAEDNIIAIGTSPYAPLWDGLFSPIMQGDDSLIERIDTREKCILYQAGQAGLSSEMVRRFVVEAEKEGSRDEAPFLAFFQIPSHKNPANMFHVGEKALIIRNCHGDVNILPKPKVIGNDSESMLMEIASDKVWISPHTTKQIFTYDLEKEKYSHTKIRTENESGSSVKRGLDLKQEDDEFIFVSDVIQKPGLYSRVDPVISPVEIEGFVKCVASRKRINVQTGQLIHGRQAFPVFYEAVPEIACLPYGAIADFVEQGMQWHGWSQEINPYILGIE